MIETPYDDFHREDYLDINQKRFDHLDILKIDMADKTVLEIGAGIGDHSDNILNYEPKSIHVTDVREENLKILREKYNDNDNVTVGCLDMDNPVTLKKSFDVCYCYGLLYHLANPGLAIETIANHTKEILLLETCVDYFQKNSVNIVQEQKEIFSQSFHGDGSRPGRIWLYKRLKEYFQYVYMPLVQPDHDQFPVDWTGKSSPNRLTRSIFIASRHPLDNPLLVDYIPSFQVRVKKDNSLPGLTLIKVKNLLLNLFSQH